MQAHRLSWANLQRAGYLSLSTRARLASCLLDLSVIFMQGSGTPTVSLGHAELASLVGVRRASIDAALNDLQGVGAIHKSYRSIIIRDEGLLRQEVEADR